MAIEVVELVEVPSSEFQEGPWGVYFGSQAPEQEPAEAASVDADTPGLACGGVQRISGYVRERMTKKKEEGEASPGQGSRGGDPKTGVRTGASGGKVETVREGGGGNS